MSSARQFLPGKTYLLTRRCTQRQFLMRPSETVNQIFLFCLARAAALHGIQLHAFCVLSNHYHLIVTDPGTGVPEFMRWLNEHSAKCINALYGRWESLWAPGSYSPVRIDTPDDLLEKMVYTLANPVEAGLVAHGADWPGLRSRPEDIGGKERTVRRPDIFFRKKGPVPRSVPLKLSDPPGFEDMSPQEFRKLLGQRVEAREAEIRRGLSAQGRKFLGTAKVLRQRPSENPWSREPRRRLNPRLACRDKWRRIGLLSLLGEFLKEYREARRRYSAGEHHVLFPAGTYWMRVHLGVRCRAPP